MELTLFLHVFILGSVHCGVSQEQLNTEYINESLDKPIPQTQQINETVPNADITDLPTDVETGNNSKIYYFKTFVAPHINLKSSNETLQTSQHSNKTTQSHEVSNQDHDLTSEDRLVFSPGKSSSSSSRKSFIEVKHHNQQFIPRSLNGGQERIYSEYKTRSGYVDENNNSFEDFLNKESVPELSTTNDNKQVSFSQSDKQNPQLSILHNYPEIIIDHITYDDDKNDKNKTVQIKPNVTEDSAQMQNVVKEEPNISPQKPRTRYNIPEEEFEIANHKPPEYFNPRNYLTPEMKSLIIAIVRKKAMHDILLKQSTENESRKQSMLLKKILQRLPERRLMSNNVKPSYLFHHERMTPADMKTLSYLPTSLETSRRSDGNHLKKSYLNAPFVPSKWEIHNRLLRKLVQMYKPEVLKRTLLVAGLIDRIVPSIEYRPIY